MGIEFGIFTKLYKDKIVEPSRIGIELKFYLEE